MFFKKIKIYITMLKNYHNMCDKKTIYFYFYSIPFFGLFCFIFIKLILILKNKKLVNIFLSHKIFLSAIRYLNISDKIYLRDNLKKYNSGNATENFFESNSVAKKKLKELKLNGFCKLGKVFTDEECLSFIKSLVNKDSYDSQVILQSSGIKNKFRPENNYNKGYQNAYFCFTPDIFLNFKPMQNLLKDKSLISLINSYLNFDASIYACHTWYNPKTKDNHYVHRLHRDYDDFKFIGLIIYWNRITKKNGATTYVKGSNVKLTKNKTKSYLEGNSGEAFLVDFSGLHSGTQVLNNYRYTTFIRFGHKFNYASVIDGFLHSMEI